MIWHAKKKSPGTFWRSRISKGRTDVKIIILKHMCIVLNKSRENENIWHQSWLKYIHCSIYILWNILVYSHANLACNYTIDANQTIYSYVTWFNDDDYKSIPSTMKESRHIPSLSRIPAELLIIKLWCRYGGRIQIVHLLFKVVKYKQRWTIADSLVSRHWILSGTIRAWRT